MTTTKFLSNKKTSQTSISISPALKDWVERYVSVKNKENPDDERYKSVSAFYCDVMERVLKMFEQGKSLDDFDKVMDSELNDLFEKSSSKLFIPLVEPSVAMGKYSLVDFKETTRYFMTFLKFIKQNLDPYSLKSIRTIFERFKRRYMNSKLTKEVILDLRSEKGEKIFSATWMHWGTYKHMHYGNCKFITEIFGLMGLKITSFDYSVKDLYFRIDFEPTNLFFRDDIAKKERIKLLMYNVKFVINYWRILNDKNYFLWMKMAEDNNLMINFKNEKARDKWMKIIEDDLLMFGPEEDFKLNLLYYFERMNWIIIDNECDLKFQITLSEEKHSEERQFLLKSLSKHSKVIGENDAFYLE